LNVAADAEWASLLGLRRWWCSAHAANDAAQHATHRAAGNAAGDPTAHARGDVGLGVFLNNFDIVGNDFWLHELAGIHQMAVASRGLPEPPRVEEVAEEAEEER